MLIYCTWYDPPRWSPHPYQQRLTTFPAPCQHHPHLSHTMMILMPVIGVNHKMMMRRRRRRMVMMMLMVVVMMRMRMVMMLMVVVMTRMR